MHLYLFILILTIYFLVIIDFRMSDEEPLVPITQSFHAHHPFIYYIKNEGIILFAGRINTCKTSATPIV